MSQPISVFERYNKPTPRYTSYPPVPHWRDANDLLLRAALKSSRRPLSVYVHVPFCERLCLYCGCNVIIKKDHSLALPYVQKVYDEIGLVKEAHGRPLIQMHWGGGTPTYLDLDQISVLFDTIVDKFPVAADAEISIEIDPRVTTVEHLRTLWALGFNRLSMGIQDFDPQVQRAVHRIQSFELTRNLMVAARALGFASINVDLMYGLPFQNSTSFARTLDSVQQLDPDRIAVFSYAHVPSLKKQQTALAAHLPSEADKLQLLLIAVGRLMAAGYEYIGMDHFAKPTDSLCEARRNGTLHRNFQGYTTHSETDLLGFGVSAISHVGNTFTQNHRNLEAYGSCIASGLMPVARGHVMTRDDRIRAATIEKLLCYGDVRKKDIEKEFEICFDEYFACELGRLDELERDGMISGVSSDIITPLGLGRTLIRSIAQVFDRYQSNAVASKAL